MRISDWSSDVCSSDLGKETYNMVMRTNPVLFPAYYPIDEDHSYLRHIMFGNYDEGQYLNPYAEMVRGYREYSRSRMLAQLELNQDFSFITEGDRKSTRLNSSH